MSAVTRPAPYGGEAKGTDGRFDFWLLLSALILLGFGLMSLYSISAGRGIDIFRRQVLNAAIGLVPFAIFYFVNPSFWRRIAPVLYATSVAMLALVFVLGAEKLGATRWIEVGPLQFQPSELAKLLMVITLATFFVHRADRIRNFSTFALSLVHVSVPLFLVFKQPHLGGTLVLVTIWLSVSIAAGVPIRYIAVAVASVPLLLAAAFYTPGVLTAEQRDRVYGLLHGDQKDSAYQATRASIAFGVGGVAGTGFLHGEQKRAGFIPMQHNDFVFTVIGEEGGLVGGALVLIAFGFFFFRVWLVMFQTNDPFARMIAAGILGMLGFHAIVNMGMVLQVLPVVGLWLPFLSHGGTALWLCMASVGLLLSIRRREAPLLF